MIRVLERHVHKTKIVDFARESLSESLVNEMMPLWEDHYEEIALYKDIPLQPDFGVYDAVEQAGNLRIYTARHEGELVGYEIVFVARHPHYATMKAANQDILFLAKDMRQGLIGYRFIKWCDERLEHEGIDVVFQHVKKSHNFGVMLERMGYVEHDIIYSRRLS